MLEETMLPLPVIHSKYDPYSMVTTIYLEIPDEWIRDVPNPAVKIASWLVTQAAVDIHERKKAMKT